MSDRTTLAIGRSTFSVPRLTKRAVQVVMAVALTALASFLILALNNVLTAHSGWRDGVGAWLAFIRRSDIIGTMVLTAVVTVATVYWPGSSTRK